MRPAFPSYLAETALGLVLCRSFARVFASSNLSCIAMKSLPFLAQISQMICEYKLNLNNLAPRKPVTLSKLNRPVRAIQIEQRFAPSAYHMDVGGTVVVWINHYSKPFKPEDCRHSFKS